MSTRVDPPPIPASGIFSSLAASKFTSSLRRCPLSLITTYLFSLDPYKNSTHEIILQRLVLRLINTEYSTFALQRIFHRLSLREFQPVREISFQHIRRILNLMGGKHCRVLDFTGCLLLTDAVALVGIESAPHIRVLSLKQCPVLSDAIFRLAVSKLRRLESLNVGNSRKLSGRGLLRCIRLNRFPANRIRELRLPSMHYVDNTIMNDICKSIGTSLEILDIENTGVSDGFLISVRRYNSGLLRLLAGNNDFSDSGILTLCDTHNKRDPLLQLIEFDTSYSNGVGDCGVLAVCGAFSNSLEVLKIAGLDDRLGVSCLHTITQSLPKLKLLDLRFCSNIRPMTIRTLIYTSTENVAIIR